jgi:hypothetical protein
MHEKSINFIMEIIREELRNLKERNLMEKRKNQDYQNVGGTSGST